MINEFEEKLRRAQGGSCDAQTSLGEDYLQGNGVEVDYEKAIYWLTLATEQVRYAPTVLLASMYTKGLGVEANPAEAIRLLTKAGLLGWRDERVEIARMYRDGNGAPANAHEAFRWYVMVIAYDPDDMRNDIGKEAYAYVYGAPNWSEAIVDLMLEDPEAEVRSSAAVVIGYQEPASIFPALLRGIEDPRESVLADVLLALRFIYDWSGEAQPYKVIVERFLLAALDNPDQRVRERAVSGIDQGEFDTPKTRARLWRVLDDPSDGIRSHSAYVLARFKEENIVPRIDAMLRDASSRHPALFAAAQETRDASLLPALRIAKERLVGELKEHERLMDEVGSAIYWLERWQSEQTD